MSTQMSIFVATLFFILLLVMRWTHRCWGKAFFATLFAPLLIVPIAAVVFLALAMIFKFLNEFLTGFGVRFTNATLTTVTGTTTIVLVLLLIIHYCREQRHLSHIETGPRLGPRYNAPKPNVYRANGPSL